MLLADFLHRMDPFVINGLPIRWYGLSYVAGFLLAFLGICWMGRRGLTPLAPSKAGDFTLAVAVGAVVGGRLGYCLLYQPDLLMEFYSKPPFWGLLAIQDGGMASHGGLVGLILACIWYQSRAELQPLDRTSGRLHLMDLTVLTGPLGLFLGRMTNFINGELYGRPCSESLPWAVRFPQEMLQWSPADPRRGQEGFLEAQSRLVQLRADGALSGGCSPAPEGPMGRLADAVAWDDSIARSLEPLLTPRHPSQIYEALLEGLLLLGILWLLGRRPRKPGVLTAWCLLVYGLLRIVGEEFRMPDAHLGLQWLGATRGQWLSSAMIVAGLICLWSWSRRSVEPLGGWGLAAGGNKGVEGQEEVKL